MLKMRQYFSPYKGHRQIRSFGIYYSTKHDTCFFTREVRVGYLKLLTVIDCTVVLMESTEGLHGLKEAQSEDHVWAEGGAQLIDL